MCGSSAFRVRGALELRLVVVVVVVPVLVTPPPPVVVDAPVFEGAAVDEPPVPAAPPVV